MANRRYMLKSKKAADKTKIKGYFARVCDCILNSDYIEEKFRDAKLVYLYIVSSGGAYGEARGISVKKIAKNIRMSTDRVSKYTNYLCKLGFLEKGPRDKNGIITYYLPTQRMDVKDYQEKSISGEKDVFIPKDKKDLYKTNIPNKFVTNHKLPPFVRIVGAILIGIMRGIKNGKAIDIAYIAKLSGFSTRHVSRALSYLKAHGYIAIIQRKYKSNLFFQKEKLLGGNNFDFISKDRSLEKGKVNRAFGVGEPQIPNDKPKCKSLLDKQLELVNKIYPFSELLELAKTCDRPFPFNQMDPEEVVGREMGIVTVPIDMEYHKKKRKLDLEQARKFGYNG